MSVYTELDALNAQIVKCKQARDAADAKLNELAQQLVAARGDFPKEQSLSGQISAIVDAMAGQDDAAAVKTATQTLAESEAKLRKALAAPVAHK